MRTEQTATMACRATSGGWGGHMISDARARHGRRGWWRVTCGCSVLEVPCVESNEMTTLSPPNCRISLAQSASAARRANALSSGTGRFGSSECNKESNTCVTGSATNPPVKLGRRGG